MGNTKNFLKKTKKLFYGAENCETVLLPFAILSGLALLLSYATESLWGYGPDTLGEGSAPGRILLSLYGVLSDIFPVVAAASIASSIASRNATPAAIAAGAVCTYGYSFLSPQGSINASGGILLAVICGIISGLTYKVLDRLLSSPMLGHYSEILSSLGAMTVSLCLAYTLTTGVYISGYLTTSLFAMWAQNEALLCITAGLLMGINPGGASYIGVFTFSRAVFAADNKILYAAMLSSAMVPQLSLSLASIIFRKKYNRKDRIIQPLCIIFALGGINTVALSQYAKKPLPHILSFSVGTVVSSVLCWLFGCTASGIEGGVFRIFTDGNPVPVILAAAVGGISGAIILGLFAIKNQVPDDT